MTASTRRVVLTRHRTGSEPSVELTAVREGELVPARTGQAEIRATHLQITPVLAEMMQVDCGLPTGDLVIGQPLWTIGVGEVASAPGGEFAPGDQVSFQGAWAERLVCDVEQLSRLPSGLPEPYFALSQGLTAYVGMAQVAEVGPGDVVFVSGASGGVGTMAGQIARARGAATLIGSALGPENTAYLEQLGYDVAIDSREGDLAERLAAAAPAGIDVYFDIVGGDQFEAALEAAAPAARFALCGAYSKQFDEQGTHPRFDLMTAIVKSIRLEGFAAMPTEERLAEWNRHYVEWLRQGEVSFPHTLVEGGLDVAAATLDSSLAGRHRGVFIVEL